LFFGHDRNENVFDIRHRKEVAGYQRHFSMKVLTRSMAFLCVWAFAVTASWATTPFPRPRGLVNDFANVVSPDFEKKMVEITDELFRKTGVPVVVVTMSDIGDEDYTEYANRLYAEWGIGKKGEDRGVLIFVAVQERKMRIETGYGMEGVIPDGVAGEIRDRYMIPYLKEDKFGEGLFGGTMAIAQLISKDAGVTLSGGRPVEKPAKKGSGLSGLIFGVFFLALLFFMGRRRGGLLPLLLFMSLGRAGSRGGRAGFGTGFGGGGFSGGFGGFGGGLSGGGGAGGSF
jgi:uncharacterized protein